MLCWLVILIFGLAIYGQTFGFGFVFDDHAFIVTNAYIKNIDNLPSLWQSFPMTRLVGMYSFAFNYAISQLNPYGYHVFNFIVHLIATGLVWAVADTLFRITERDKQFQDRRRTLPFIVALIFLVHPCQTQAVTYITQRFESMSTVFYLGAVYSYIRARLAPAGLRRVCLFILCGISTALGIMTKETSVTIPLMILAAEWILFKSFRNINSVRVGIFACGGIIFIALFMKLARVGLNVFIQPVLSESHDGDVLTPFNYALTQMRVFLTFTRLFVFPGHQNLDYDYPMSTGLFSPPLTVAGIALIGLIVWLIARWRHRFPLIAFGGAWVLVSFAINMVPRSNVIFEHKMYLISFGFILSVVVGMSMIVRDRRYLMVLFSGIIIVLAVTSFIRNQVWRNEMSLWEDIVRKSPRKARAHANLGRVYGDLNRLDDALRCLNASININPNDDRTYLNRGVIHKRLGMQVKALDDFNNAIAINPNYFPTYIRRAGVYMEQHRYNAALDDLSYAMRLEPNHEDAYVQRGLLWMQVGRLELARKDFKQALRIVPQDASIQERYKEAGGI